MDDYIIKRSENPDEVREFDKGKYEVVNLPHMTIGKATYHKGWKWSDDVSPPLDAVWRDTLSSRRMQVL